MTAAITPPRRRPGTRPGGGAGRRLAAVAATLLAVPLAPAPAHAAPWVVPKASRDSGTFTMASTSYAFGGSDPASFSLPLPVALLSTTGYASLRNTGSTAARFSGGVDATGVPSAARVTLVRCAVAFSGGACASGQATLVNSAALSGDPVVAYGNGSTLAANQTIHLKITVTALAVLSGTVTLLPLTGTLPTGGANRTAG
ncbi:hypothetical protein GCM10010124_27660 [Pilimelia terevasa]|uniref:Uncharacterized protein n=1 Tax=Pilimelia terevasa TaxID=53372 RepID=A0A8J3BRE9_9ACTN|nr:hypothetical protein [Pilimelia terevasa]GGK33388.1 hypothetical protein GCM10010124_27660 [Pilimelia terevasa]